MVWLSCFKFVVFSCKALQQQLNEKHMAVIDTDSFTLSTRSRRSNPLRYRKIQAASFIDLFIYHDLSTAAQALTVATTVGHYIMKMKPNLYQIIIGNKKMI